MPSIFGEHAVRSTKHPLIDSHRELWYYYRVVVLLHSTSLGTCLLQVSAFLLLTSIPRADTISMCYGFLRVFHHSTPPVTCPPQVTISGVLFLSFFILTERRCFFVHTISLFGFFACSSLIKSPDSTSSPARWISGVQG